MEIEPKLTKSKITLDSGPDFNLFKLSALLAGVAISVASIREYSSSREMVFLLLTATSFFFIFLIARSIFKTMPSRIEIDSDSVSVFDVPTFLIEFNQAYFPIVCHRKLVEERHAFTLQWMGSQLTWHDRRGGRNIFLASKEDSAPLVAWFENNGILVPPTPPK